MLTRGRRRWWNQARGKQIANLLHTHTSPAAPSAAGWISILSEMSGEAETRGPRAGASALRGRRHV